MSFSMTVKTAEQRQADAVAALTARVAAAIDSHVEGLARACGYNSAAHLASYASSTVPAWAAEAQAFVAWRDRVWIAAFAHQAAVEAGQADATVDAALAALPAWRIS